MDSENDMDDSEVENGDTDQVQRKSAPRPGLPRLSVRTAEQGRRVLVRLLREFKRDPKPDVAKFRASIYALSVVLSFFQFEKDAEIEKRIEAIEAQLEKV